MIWEEEYLYIMNCYSQYFKCNEQLAIIMLIFFVALSMLMPLAFATKLVVTRTRPTSNSTGNSFTMIPVRDGVVGSRSQQSSLESSFVDDKIAELRKAGQSSPTGLTYLQIGLSNPDVDSNEVVYQALIDTGSAFNVVNLLVMEQLAMPLGSECKIRWGGKEE